MSSDNSSNPQELEISDICRKYKKYSENLSRAKLRNYLDQLGLDYDFVWSQEQLVKKLDQACQLLDIPEKTTIIAPKPQRPLRLQKQEVRLLEAMSNARQRDLDQLKHYCRQLNKMSEKDLKKKYYKPFMNEVMEFIRELIKKYDLDIKQLIKDKGVVAIMMNCDYLKRLLHKAYRLRQKNFSVNQCLRLS